MAIIKFGPERAIDEGADSEFDIPFIEAGEGAEQLDADAITAITATLSDIRTGDIINERELQAVLGENGGTMAVDGTLTLQLGPLDNIIRRTGAPRTNFLEQHRLVLIATYDRAGSDEPGQCPAEVHFYVREIAHMPSGESP